MQNKAHGIPIPLYGIYVHLHLIWPVEYYSSVYTYKHTRYQHHACFTITLLLLSIVSTVTFFCSCTCLSHKHLTVAFVWCSDIQSQNDCVAVTQKMLSHTPHNCIKCIMHGHVLSIGWFQAEYACFALHQRQTSLCSHRKSMHQQLGLTVLLTYCVTHLLCYSLTVSPGMHLTNATAWQEHITIDIWLVTK